MFCKNCGTQISDGAAFCSSCGATTNGNAPKIQPTVTQFTGANSYNASSNAIQPDIYSNLSPVNAPQRLCSGFACFMTSFGVGAVLASITGFVFGVCCIFDPKFDFSNALSIILASLPYAAVSLLFMLPSIIPIKKHITGNKIKAVLLCALKGYIAFLKVELYIACFWVPPLFLWAREIDPNIYYISDGTGTKVLFHLKKD
ncbi:zinc-ribbon domain-containing protein [Butyrivibrio fibrisolvens DSM 3071]|uniref:Zinc-ribbon domain-containing protein n=1 Tax=Butyrivibrio fibrisolvens DSM 3071 TaxID=1121131 RepID=A0A1M5TUG4_BUTFI|nr:zinc ribbon domain-containing protein [Butyrivibrio fibrisolvens]SHH54455.1 zinc-ribbon domain-containing protein [Butyrivibrio fibrisolvens DSM 3071]